MATLKNLKAAFLFLAVCLLLFTSQSCKKKDDTVSLPVFGTWQSLTDTTYSYLVFGEDYTVSTLKETSYGIHTFYSNAFSADAEQITFSTGGSSGHLYNYRISNDSLYISNSTEYIVLKRNTAITLANWTKKANVVESHAVGSGSGLWFGALEWDGTSFLISSTFAHKIYKVSRSSWAVTDSVAVAQKGSGIAVVGVSIWIPDYNVDKKLHTVDFTGATLFNSTDCTENPAVLAAEGSNIWAFTANSELYSYNTLTNTFTFKQSLPGFISLGGGLAPDMVIKDGFAYMAFGAYILKFDLLTYHVADTYAVYTGDVNLGIAYDGTDFYTLSVSLAGGLSDLNIHLNKVQLQ